VTTRTLDPAGAASRGSLVLGNVIRAAATTQAVIDGFVAVGLLTALALLIMVSRRQPPEGPALAPPLFRARESKSS
jgi:hypothetical protein